MNQTTSRKHRQQRDRKLYGAYVKLMNQPGAMASACEQILMKRFRVSRSTVQKIKKQMKNHDQPV